MDWKMYQPEPVCVLRHGHDVNVLYADSVAVSTSTHVVKMNGLRSYTNLEISPKGVYRCREVALFNTNSWLVRIWL